MALLFSSVSNCTPWTEQQDCSQQLECSTLLLSIKACCADQGHSYILCTRWGCRATGSICVEELTVQMTLNCPTKYLIPYITFHIKLRDHKGQALFSYANKCPRRNLSILLSIPVIEFLNLVPEIRLWIQISSASESSLWLVTATVETGTECHEEGWIWYWGLHTFFLLLSLL